MAVRIARRRVPKHNTSEASTSALDASKATHDASNAVVDASPGAVEVSTVAVEASSEPAMRSPKTGDAPNASVNASNGLFEASSRPVLARNACPFATARSPPTRTLPLVLHSPPHGDQTVAQNSKGRLEYG